MGNLVNDCNENGISLAEWAALFFWYTQPGQSINDILTQRGLLRVSNNTVVITAKGISLVDSILSSSGNNIWEDEELIKKMQDLFPTGKKGGTAYYYRGSKAEISRKLKSFMAKYPDTTKEQVLAATANYVDSFHGDYKYLQLLKYFIEKDGESQLISYIENIGQVNADSKDYSSVVL